MVLIPPARRLVHWCLVAMAGWAWLVPGGDGAVADSSAPDRARALVASGAIRPLSEALTRLETRYPGDVLEVELEVEDHDRVLYEIKLIDAKGRVMEVSMDAATLEVLEVEGDDD